MKRIVLIILIFFGLNSIITASNLSEKISTDTKTVNISPLGESMNTLILPWVYINTGLNHTISLPAGSVTFDNSSISVGDFVGVFYEDNGMLVCAGYREWSGNNTAIAAWGANASVGLGGFQLGEAFKWKVWRASDGLIFDMVAIYQPIAGYIVSGSSFVANGMSGVISLTEQAPSGVSFSGLGNSYCQSDADVVLTGSPTGGTFSGTGISGDVFSPVLAGVGSFNITYSYTNTSGVSSSYVQSVIVYSSPVADLGADQQLCSPITAILDAGSYSLYIWSSGETTQTINIINTGIFSVTITDSNSCIGTDEIDISSFPETVVSFTGLDAGYCTGDQPVVLTGDPAGGTFSGTGISGNFFIPSIVPSGNYIISYSYVDNNSCTANIEQSTSVGMGISIDLGVDQIICADQGFVIDAGQFDSYLWSDGSTTQTLPANVSGTYSITVTDVNGCVSSDNIVITVLGTPVSGLNSLYTLIPGQTIQLVADSGFVSYLWNDASTGEFVSTSYPGEFFVTMESTNGCVGTDTIDVEFDLDAVHIVNIPSGWSYFSTYVDPYQPSIDVVFAPVYNDLVIVKNGTGLVYWPAFFLNLIGDHVVGEGYQIKVNAAVTLPVSGLMVVPEWTPITMPSGWSIIGYLRYVPGDVVDILLPIVADVIIMKNGEGQFYWPAFSLNMIGDFNPGQGYLIMLNQTVSFTYPWNGSPTKSGSIPSIPQQYFSSVTKSSGANMSMVIPESAWNEKPVLGDEIAIVNSSGLVCGSSVYNGGNIGVTIWGDDMYTEKVEYLKEDEQFYIKIWNSRDNTESFIYVSEWETGNSIYNTNELVVVKKIESRINQNSITTSCFPNPFNRFIEIEFTIPFEENVIVNIINSTGKIISVLENNDFSEGTYSLEYDSKSISSGVYYYQIITSNGVITKPLVKL